MEHDKFVKLFKTKDEEQYLWLLLTCNQYAIFRAREKELRRYSISPEQVSLLFAVQTLESKATPAKIARYLLIQPHTIIALIDQMVKKEFIKKVNDLASKNWNRVTITEKGQKACKQSMKRELFHQTIGRLNRDKKKDFSKYLESIMFRLAINDYVEF